MKEIYLDNAATTKVYDEVAEVMKKSMLENYGNPSSLHKKGEESFEAINSVRKKIAFEIGCKAHEIVFTSGATESNNLAIQGIAKGSDKKKIIISSTEHPSVNEVCNYLEGKGYEIVRIGVDKSGKINFEELEKEIDENTLLVSVILVNNVFGTIQDIRKIGKLCRARNVIFHTDAVQGFGKLKINVNDWCVDLLSASGHKIKGPKGIGFLYVREGLDLKPLFYGGEQEAGFRSGTENVPGIIGIGKALELYKKKNWREVQEIRDLFISKLDKIGARVNGALGDERICNNIHVTLSKDAEEIIHQLSLKGVYVSAGSACDSKKQKEDLVLEALGLNEDEARKSIRISIGDDITKDDVERVVGEVEKIIC